MQVIRFRCYNPALLMYINHEFVSAEVEAEIERRFVQYVKTNGYDMQHSSWIIVR